jgi:hypothetical protein
MVLTVVVATGHIPPKEEGQVSNSTEQITFRSNCDLAKAQVEQSVNNVRARLTTGGDVWWDGNNARYIVPKVPPGQPEVASIFAGAVWLGGVDAGGQLKLAAQTYGRSSGQSDFWPGPLTPLDAEQPGQTEQLVCSDWDKLFHATGDEIDEHLRNFTAAEETGEAYEPELIPDGVKGWPAQGNPFFFEVHGFDLPVTQQSLAGFKDENQDGIYNPLDGDYPTIEIRGCLTNPQYPDDMYFWIYNDNGNTHTESNALPIQMEVQVQAFAYATNDELNNMTFQRYKLINRALEPIDSTFFAMWVDPDLGCYTDDYVGCDTSRSLAFIYNEDGLDGQTGCTCPQGVETYCDEIPVLGVDYFRGPEGPAKVDEDGNIFEPDTPGAEDLKDTLVELGMSSFTYYHNGGDNVPDNMTDPQNGEQYYNYLTGSWRSGEPFQFGGDAYQENTESIQYAFISEPDDESDDAWSMCSEDLPPGDRRTIQASGPFRLDPGAVNELIIGVVWVPDLEHPCPNIRELQNADDIAQALFDNCFELPEGPDAPDVDIIELDKELILVLTNDTVTSNNAYEQYAEEGLEIPDNVEDNLYRFEGYRVYQVASPNVVLTEANRNNTELVRPVATVDLINNVTEIYDWVAVDGPNNQDIFTPVLRVDGDNNGIRHTFRITTDAFGGDLVNHRPYYYTVIAYGYNNYEDFDPETLVGQREPYIESSDNIGPNSDGLPYTAIPRPITDRELNAVFGDGAVITRSDGEGSGDNFLDIGTESRAEIEETQILGNGEFSGEITYAPGRGPVAIKVYNPLEVIDGNYEIQFVDGNLNDDVLESDARWILREQDNPGEEILSARTIEQVNEQTIAEFGFSVTIGQVPEPGSLVTPSNGFVGAEIEYSNPETQEEWLSFVPEETNLFPVPTFDDNVFNYFLTGDIEPDVALDPDQGLSQFGQTPFLPYYLLGYVQRDDFNFPYISPVYNDDVTAAQRVRSNTTPADLNNVDIVFTPNKDLWSRCVVVETANRFYRRDPNLETEGDIAQFFPRQAPSVTKNAGPDGLPEVDPDETRLGFGWFPGYAINVETGQRLNIFFGENSAYRNDPDSYMFPYYEEAGIQPTGGDMMFNPSWEILLANALNDNNPALSPAAWTAGGQHMVYVTDQPYDECENLYTFFNGPSIFKSTGLQSIRWAGMILSTQDTPMRSYEEGLIPEEVRVKMRVTNSYQVETGDDRTGTGENNFHPLYRFSIDGLQSTDLVEENFEDALDQILVVPNPYYGFSEYETSQFTNTIKITNLPAQCTVSIYTLEGKFIRQYQRDEIGMIPEGNNRGIRQAQINPALEWDLRNSRGIPVASGVYLIHIAADGLGERTIKWFGVARQFDPSGL